MSRFRRLRELRRRAVTVLVGASLVWVTGAVPVAADQTSDIPGIPLPGTVTSGLLGGPVYDVVFYVEVPAGSVLVASLTGPVGTDFDLYLFDQTATTVLSNSGLVAKSIGPTSTETISHPSSSGGTFYIDLNGASDAQGTYTLTVQIVPDATPPSLSLRLGLGHAATNQATVSVEVLANDDLSGVKDMAFSADGVAFGPWQTFSKTSSWTFPQGDGAKTLWAKVRNGVGLESGPGSATIVLDTVAPSIADLIPPQGARVAGLRPAFSIRFGEAIDPASWSSYGLIVQATSGALVTGRYSLDATGQVGTFVPDADLIAGARYIVTVGSVTDLAGNKVAPLGSWLVTPLIPSHLTVTAAPTVVVRGGSAVLTGRAEGPGIGVALDLTGQLAVGGVVLLGPLAVPGNDPVHVTVRPAMNTIYRLSYAGTSTVAAAEASVRILVRRSVALVGVSTARAAPARVGRSVQVVAAIGPATAGVSVSLRLYRFDTSRRAWVYAGSRGRTSDAAGRVSTMWTPTSAGSYYWRAVVASTVDFANNISPIYRWSVTR
jgi:Bacterial Ig-like domain